MRQYLRAFIPSWRFFDRELDSIILSHRVSADGETFSEWTQTLHKPPVRKWHHLFLNPDQNRIHAYHSLLEHLKDDLVDGDNPEVSIELIRNLVEFEAKPERYFQFRIDSESVEFVSDVYLKGSRS